MTQSPSKITAILVARPGKSAELRALLVGMAPHSRAEPGNLHWDVWRDTSNEDRYVLDELYRDVAAVEAHRTTPHYQAYLAKIPELADRTAVVLEAVEVGGR
ncbi:putative quinol monooxygenase [Bradyrhizobium iriomotense]|uniref:putative quinol monooxygenase n=1 Tax=Bradyrhizobium iriomotense TaxID=441950 RepID=UPI001B89DE39|nr:putative quinol monooxygenase [Bradyrhizobium iriomotense]MBR0782490.1 antibiotic biosynthesis monooxygenase [Bradyrhizobium iriomotense]